jgi:hypothetical protein
MSLFVSACGGGDSSPAAGSPPPPPPPVTGFPLKATFTDFTFSSGISRVFSITNPNGVTAAIRIGGGIAASDFDNDNDIDIYLVGGDGETNKLFRNDGNNLFTNVTAAWNLDVLHLGSGPAFADIDGDGDLDLFVGSVEGDSVHLFRRDVAQFTDVTANSGLNISGANTISASFTDYDQDGDLDLFLAHWRNDSQPDTESLWQNNGDGTFTSASIQSGIADQLIEAASGPSGSRLRDYSFAAVFSDIDNDEDADLLLAADFLTSKVFRNDGDGTFSNTTDRNVIVDRNGMGNAVGDYDNDGDMDWFVTSIFDNSGTPNANIGNRLYRNLGDGTFEDVTEAAGVADGGWGWGSCMEDFDNDGDLDIFHVNGWIADDPGGTGSTDAYTSDQVRYFESRGDGTFIEAATLAHLTDTGQGRGVACFDSDRDGDLDIVISNNEDRRSVVFYRNELAGTSRYLGVRLVGKGLNTAAIGARIEVSDGIKKQFREIRAGNNFVSQSPAEAHFGLGALQNVAVTVTWPDGSRSLLSNVPANQLLTITQP